MGGYGTGGYGTGGYGQTWGTGNSSTTLQSVVDYAKTYPDLSPVLGVVGSSREPALTIANDVITEMLAPKFNWKWNRIANNQLQPFYTISWQQDYATPTPNIGWIEHCEIIDINNTALPKPWWPVEAVRDLPRTSTQFGRPGQICWLPNDQMIYGTWGASPGIAGNNNPGPNVVLTNPLGQPSTPTNPCTQVIDPNGNYQIVTTYGQCGAVAPSWPTSGSPPNTNTTDGGVIWTTVDPKARGFRLNPIPPQSGVVYLVVPVCQMRPPKYFSLSAVIDPVPDDYASYFRRGFIAHCYDHSPDPKVRQKAVTELAIWRQSMEACKEQGDRERDSAGFYPSASIMDAPMIYPAGPANPYGPTGAS
jgi:hypothetical protein